MNKFLEEKVLPVASKLAQNKFMCAVRDGVTVIIPFSIIGAFALIIACFPLDAWTNFIEPYANYIYTFSTVSLNILGLIALVGMGYNFGVQYEIDPISNTLVTLVTFFMVTLVGNPVEGFKINVDSFGAVGMFCGIITAFVVTLVFKFFIEKNIVVKMPDGVPPAVTNTFISLLPAIACVFIAWILRVVLGIDINSIITALFSPLVKGYESLPGYLLYVFLVCCLWVLGIHGNNTLAAIAEPIVLAMTLENMAAYQAGEAIPNVATFCNLFTNFSGTGCTIGLVLNMLFSKCKRYKELGKLAILPGLFNINEPVTFGAPVVMNPIFAIPFIITPLVLSAATYLLMQFNIIGRVCVEVPWTCPPIIGAYLATGFNIPAAIWNALEMVISFFIYRPFFKKQETIELAAEGVAQ